jgi:hypothetical protein
VTARPPSLFSRLLVTSLNPYSLAKCGGYF